MAVSYIASIVVMISDVSIVVVSVRGGVCVMLVMVMITGVMRKITVISVVSIVALTVSVCIHISSVSTAYTVIHFRSITTSVTCVVAISSWLYMSMIGRTM